MRQSIAVALGILVSVATGLPASAAGMIGVNFVGNGASLSADEAAGVVQQPNWNNATGFSGTGIALNNDAGTVSGATLTYNSHTLFGLQAYPSPLATGDEKLMNGVIMSYYISPGDWPASIPATATISNIPAAYQASGYDAYVYVGADWNALALFANQVTMVTVGSTDYYSLGNQYHQASFAYNEITSTDPNNPTHWGNYIHVKGLTGDTLTVTESSWSGGIVGTHGIYGVQLVQMLLGDTNHDGVVDVVDLNNVFNNLGTAGPLGDTDGSGVVDVNDLNNVFNNLGTVAAVGGEVPEPATLALLALGGLAMMRRRCK